MSNESYGYLVGKLESEELTPDEVSDLESQRDGVQALLKKKLGNDVTIKYGGSKAKQTMVRASYDLDIICYFPSDYDATLKEIYNLVRRILKTEYAVENKRSAIRIVRKGSKSYHIDVVPGKYIGYDSQDAFIYQQSGDKQRLKTNIQIHVDTVEQSQCRPIIRLLKVWRLANALDIKTFVFELFVIKALDNWDDKDNLALSFREVIRQLSQTIDTIRLEDPANSNNIISDQISDNDKVLIKDAAAEALIILEDDSKNELEKWESIFGETSEQKDLAQHFVPTTLSTYPLGDSNHAKLLPYVIDVKKAAKIVADLYYVSDKGAKVKLKPVASQSRIKSGTKIKYRVKTNVKGNYIILWQVVNTGEHAASKKDGLRGEFFKAKLIGGGISPNHLINWESAEYTGKHWIEAFIIKDNKCIAQTGKFYINITNPSWP